MLAMTLDHNDRALVDGTWTMAGSADALDPFLAGTQHIIETDKIKQLAPSERANGSTAIFGEAGLTGTERLAVYDRAGLFSSPWIWWLLRSHGVDVSLFEGWGETVETPDAPGPSQFSSSADPHLFNATKQDVLAALGTNIQILDARPSGRFDGASPEPRPECRSGHIPGSLNVPFGQLKSGRSYLSQSELQTIFEDKGIDLTKPIITSCGSGVTASGLAFALTRCGAENVRVYQGSWAEWGIDPELPIETAS